jgi:hypothetical protein
MNVFTGNIIQMCRSQWPRGLKHRSTTARLLRLWVYIPPGSWMIVCCECCVLSGRSLCDELITRPEESYRLWCVVVCDLETSRMRRPWPELGCSATKQNYQDLQMKRMLENREAIHTGDGRITAEGRRGGVSIRGDSTAIRFIWDHKLRLFALEIPLLDLISSHMYSAHTP